jgi:hypothetical protein
MEGPAPLPLLRIGSSAAGGRGVFATQEEAKAYVKRLQRAGDNLVDIFMMDLYNWAPVPPNPMEIENSEYQETFLNDLMQGYAESQRSAKEVFADRKSKVMKDGLDAHLLPEERLPPPTGPLPPPEVLPKLEKVVEEVTEDEPAEELASTVTEAVEKIFDKDDIWMSRHEST